MAARFPDARFHLAMPVEDLAAARRFYGEVLGLEQGRGADTWVDWNMYGQNAVEFKAFADDSQVFAV
jgi:extradiol dioxygenase family protein